jgi:hypothetical protein
LGHGVGAPSTSAASSASGAIKELGIPVSKQAQFSAYRPNDSGFVKNHFP